jgi:hypothetical protein
MDETRKRRWVWPTLFGSAIAGVLFACWVGYYLNWIHERHNAQVGFCIGLTELRFPDGTTKIETVSRRAPWPLNWFGEPGRLSLMIPESLPKEEIDRIVALFPEADPDFELVAVDPAKAGE